MRLVRMNKRSRYRGLACMYCHRRVTDGRVALCSTYYVYPTLGDGDWAKQTVTRAHSLNKADDTAVLARPEFKVKVVYHRRCMEKILTNPRGPYDPEVEQSMYEEYRGQLLERFEERKPGAVRYPSEVPAVPDGGRDGAANEDVPV